MEKEKYQITFQFKNQISFNGESVHMLQDLLNSSELSLSDEQIESMLYLEPDVHVECRRVYTNKENKN